MERKFAGQLDIYIRQAGLPLRTVASQSGIPHQTIYNWLKGTQPRRHPGLPGDLRKLGSTLGLTRGETGLLMELCGYSVGRPGTFDIKETVMENTYRIPRGWVAAGEAPEHYAMGVDPEVTYNNRACITIQAGPDPIAFAAFAQNFKAEAYRGKRIRFSAAVRSQQLENRAALFMRIAAADDNLLAFDNMKDRAIYGTTDWEHYSIVLDVAQEAEDIVFGILLSLQGQVWMADVRLDEVGLDVPTTDIVAEILPYFPTNLGFSE